MKKIVVAAVMVVIALVAITFALNASRENTNPDSANNQSSQSQEAGMELPTHLEGAVMRDTLDATGQKNVAVAIGDFFFSPTILTVSKGTVVTWTNEGQTAHTVTSSKNSPKTGLNSDILQTGDSYSFTFDEPGTYYYLCAPHPASMRGIVNVTE